MAKKKGFFGTLGTLFRVAIVVLAGILVYAIWQNYSQPDVVAEADAPADGDQPVEQALEAADTDEVVSDAVEQQLEEAADTELPDTEGVDVQEEIATVTGDAVEAASDVTEQAEEAVTDVAETANEVRETAEEAVAGASEMASEAVDQAEDVLDQAEETVTNLAEDAEQAVGDLANTAEATVNALLNPESETAASSMAAIKVPGDDTVYALIETTRADDGSIDVISQKTGDDATLTLSRVTCAPLSLGVKAAGATRDELATEADPEMERLVLGTPEAALAAYACGAVK